MNKEYIHKDTRTDEPLQRELQNYFQVINGTALYYEIYVKQLHQEIDRLNKENERLNENNQAMQEEMARTWKIADDYKSRIDKAIECINQNKHLSMFADCREPEEDWNYDLEINPRELLNILECKDE